MASRRKRKQEKSEDQPDITKRPIGIVLPVLITGVFSLAVVLFTWWLNQESHEDEYSGEDKTEKIVECELTHEISDAIADIEKYGFKSEIDSDDKLFLSAFKEKFESYLLNPDICSKQKTTVAIFEEIATVNEILFYE